MTRIFRRSAGAGCSICAVGTASRWIGELGCGDRGELLEAAIVAMPSSLRESRGRATAEDVKIRDPKGALRVQPRPAAPIADQVLLAAKEDLAAG